MTEIDILEQLELSGLNDRRIDDFDDPLLDDHYALFFDALESDDPVLMMIYATYHKKRYPESPWPELMVGWSFMRHKKYGAARQSFFHTIVLARKFRRRVDYCYERMKSLGILDPWEEVIGWGMYLCRAIKAEELAQEGVRRAEDQLGL